MPSAYKGSSYSGRGTHVGHMLYCRSCSSARIVEEVRVTESDKDQQVTKGLIYLPRQVLYFHRHAGINKELLSERSTYVAFICN